jgi:SAM-dependent methyltransferase
VNAYSETWFELFMATIDPAQTAREVAFLDRQIPLPAFRRVLDVCCGAGRHAALLVERGYELTGIDVNRRALDEALASIGSRATLRRHDMRRIDQLDGSFNAVLLLWQSFGQFDDATNLDVLRQIARKLTAGGRFVLDIYHRGFFETRLGERTHEKLGRRITELKDMRKNRLVVDLDYGDGRGDRFAWRVFTPDEIVELARQVGLNEFLRCADFEESIPPSTDRPRMQLVFEKR